MTAADVLDRLVQTNLAAGAAILAVIALRKMFRPRFGARVAYGLWLLPVLAAAAALAPARQIMVAPSAAPAAAVGAHALASSSGAAAGPDASSLLVGVWLAGVAAAALVMAGVQHRFMRQARRGAAGPSVVGVIAPRIVMPDDFAERYSREEQALILAHERTHIARQDSRLNGLCAAAQCLCWFNPLAHLAARLMRIDQELACDEVVVTRFPDARRAYAEVLVKAQLAVLPLPLGCYWPPKSEHPLVERLAMLKLDDIGRARRFAGAAVLVALCAGDGLTAWASQPPDVRLAPPRPAGEIVAPRRAETAAAAPRSHRTSAPRDLGHATSPPGEPPPTAGRAVAGSLAVSSPPAQDATPPAPPDAAAEDAGPVLLAQLQPHQSDTEDAAPQAPALAATQPPDATLAEAAVQKAAEAQRRRKCWNAEFPKRACMSERQWAEYMRQQRGGYTGGNAFPPSTSGLGADLASRARR
jgi:beta-lactamase regulating signal transducer with metallopeptidase domain